MYQLDIFADSASVQRANDLNAALASFDRVASKLALQRLIAVDRHHSGLPSYRVLCDFLDHWADSCETPDWQPTPQAIAAEEQLIREQLIPATLVMGSAAGELVRRCWRALAQKAEAAGIPPEHHDYFAAELYLRAQQFPDAVRNALAVAGGDMRATVQRWLGLGYWGCLEQSKARTAAMRYAWLAPQHFNDLVEEARDTLLTRDWNDFQSDLGELDASWFPAWCAHEKRTGCPLLENLPSGDGTVAYRLITDLTIRERGGLGQAIFEDRARLKKLNQIFFDFYMERRSDLHPNLSRQR